jgi:hypothetical protein
MFDVWREIVAGVGDAVAVLSEEHLQVEHGATTSCQPYCLEKSFTVADFAHPRAGHDGRDGHAILTMPHFSSPRWSDFFHW